MKIKPKQIDCLLNQAIDLTSNLLKHDFMYTITWDNYRSKINLALWENCYIDNYGFFHRIKLNIKAHDNSNDLFNSICHELIHAWQYENDYNVNHDLEFIRQCIKFEKLGINTYSIDCDLNDINLMKEGV